MRVTGSDNNNDAGGSDECTRPTSGDDEQENNTANTEDLNPNAVDMSDEVSSIVAPSSGSSKRTSGEGPSYLALARLEQAREALADVMPGAANFIPKLYKFRANEVYYRAQALRVHVLSCVGGSQSAV